jgi:tetratricopeptide (TPR) repeat protein
MARSVRLNTASDIIDLIDFVQLLAMNTRTGRLRIRNGDAVRELVLLAGAIVSFSGGDDEAVHATETDEPDAVRRHCVVERFLEVLAWSDPDLEFTELTPDEIREIVGPGSRAPLSVQGTLLEVVQARDLLRRTAEVLPDLDAILVPVRGKRDDYDGSPYEPILNRMDGRQSIREVIASFGVEEYGALERLASLVRQDVVTPVDPLQLEMLAWEYESGEDHERALNVYRLLRRESPDNVRILKNIAGVLAQLGRTEEAAAALGEYAESCARDGLEDEARRSFSLAMRFDPENLEIRESFVDTLARDGPSPALIEETLELADRYARSADPVLAKGALRRILRMDPEHVAAHRRLADLCRSLGEEGAAIAELTQLASIERREGRSAEALTVCEEALALDPHCLEAALMRAELLVDQGDASRALEKIRELEHALRDAGAAGSAHVVPLLERIHDIDPECTGALESLVEYCARGGDMARAVELEGRLVTVLARQGEIRRAIRALESLIHQLPEAFDLHAQLADLYLREGEAMRASAIFEFAAQGLLDGGRHAEAARVYGRLLELDPDSPEAALGFARALRGRGEVHRAVLRYREAARQLEGAGRVEESIAVLEEALAAEPGEPDCTLAAARLHEIQGHRRRAIHLYLAALKVCRERGDPVLADRFQRLVLEHEPDNAVAREGGRV